MSGEILFTNGIFHSGLSETDTFSHMTVRDGTITAVYTQRPGRKFNRVVDLGGQHVYPCLIDTHVHLLLTVAVMAMGFSVCEITQNGVEPNTMEGVAQRIRAYAALQPKGAVVACNNFIVTAVREHRMPTKQELDDWGGGRPVVIYNIDGHSTSLSSAMLAMLGLESDSGILQGEENERTQGRIIDIVGSKMTAPLLAKGIANFQNTCAAYGISTVAALEGNGDSPKDATTGLIVRLARHMDIGVRLYLQYTDLERTKPFRKWMRRPRIGGCGDWEMDGAIGSHSAAFPRPYRDTGGKADCYFTQEETDSLVSRADAAGFQIASHAIGTDAIDRLVSALEKLNTTALHRVEHCEFPSKKALEVLKKGKYAVVMQPGYAWIDKRYLHTYETFLPEGFEKDMYLKTLYDAGVCLCGSSDSPVQELDPWLQMLGMTQFYREEESLTPYQAFRCYTANAARALGEEAERGTLEPGKAADFFTASQNLFTLPPEAIVSFRPTATWYGSTLWKNKTGTLTELAGMLVKAAKKV